MCQRETRGTLVSGTRVKRTSTPTISPGAIATCESRTLTATSFVSANGFLRRLSFTTINYAHFADPLFCFPLGLRRRNLRLVGYYDHTQGNPGADSSHLVKAGRPGTVSRGHHHARLQWPWASLERRSRPLGKG